MSVPEAFCYQFSFQVNPIILGDLKQRIIWVLVLIISRYLDLRGVSNGRGPVIWPAHYGPAERDKVYQTFSLSGWPGRSGHDAPMIALDALLASGSDWEELMSRAAFHGGGCCGCFDFWKLITAMF